MQAFVTIHDLMPHTMERVEGILDWLKDCQVPPVTLLVVPGRPWAKQQIVRLRELAGLGHPLAAHGWCHQTQPRRLYHRLHAALISRKVAEHLDLDSSGIRSLMQRSHQWFAANQLPLPDFYVPPAWALGPIDAADLAELPYRWIETTRGLIHLQAESGHPGACFQHLPLTGYEADTFFRSCFLRLWNCAQARKAREMRLPLRISIHPDDLNLRIADQLAEQIAASSEFISINDFSTFVR